MGWEDEVLEGALIDAYHLSRRAMFARGVLAESEATLFGVGALGDEFSSFLLKILLDVEAHLRSCQWHGDAS